MFRRLTLISSNTPTCAPASAMTIAAGVAAPAAKPAATSIICPIRLPFIAFSSIIPACDRRAFGRRLADVIGYLAKDARPVGMMPVMPLFRPAIFDAERVIRARHLGDHVLEAIPREVEVEIDNLAGEKKDLADHLRSY